MGNNIVKALLLLFLLGSIFSCGKQAKNESAILKSPNGPYLVVLGIAQDAGFPQVGCQKACCQEAWTDPNKRKLVSCIALVEPAQQKAWVFDATPDFKDQLKRLERLGVTTIAGIFLTHAHIGHYTGLMHLGREAMGAKNVRVYAMPRMKYFLESNGPWSQLVELENIQIRPIQKNATIDLGSGLAVIPYQVPHRDEYSETVGYKIVGPSRSAIFIPDIDKWQKWDRNIEKVIQVNDIALLDGSFYKNGEIPGRDMSLIPHPFLVESMDLLKTLPPEEKTKIHFIHFNHTNPVLKEGSAAHKNVLERGFLIARELQFFEL